MNLNFFNELNFIVMGKQAITVFCLILFILPSQRIFSQWTVSGNLNSGYVNALIADGERIFAGTYENGVFRSDDNGNTWLSVNSGFGNSLNVQCLAYSGNYVYAGTGNGGFFYTADNGANWIQSNQGITQTNIVELLADGDTVYAGCYFAGVFRSTNNGMNFSRFALGEGDLLHSIFKNSPDFLLGLLGGIYRSSNHGANWFVSHNGITNLDIRSIVQSANKIYCGTYGGGVFVTANNGVIWSSWNAGLTGLRIYKLYSRGNNLFASVYGKGINYFDNSSGNWTDINQGLTDTNIVSIAVNDEFIFAGAASGKVWKRSLSEIVTGISLLNNNTAGDFRLFQNYPNPFNPSTSLEFSIPVFHSNSGKVFVTLKIYDILGEEIETLVSENLKPGKYKYLFDGNKLSSGVYFYKLSAGGFTETRKMLLLK